MGVSFNKQDVEAAGKAKPWTHRDEFTEEVDTEHMADTASSFAKAAGEARNAGDFAERATRIGQQAGTRDGAAFVEDERIDITADGLQGNGAGIDTVVRLLVRSMNLAIDTVEGVDAQIDGGDGKGGLQQVLKQNVSAAESTWRQAKDFFADCPLPTVADSLRATPTYAPDFMGPRVRETPAFWFQGVKYEGVRGDDTGAPFADAFLGSPAAWSAPEELPIAIREHYLKATVQAATEADQEITDSIRAYRKKLTEYGAELEESGYDTSDGPLGVWHTDEMATFNGEQVKGLLGQQNPDSQLLAQYTNGLNSLAEDMRGKNGAEAPTPEQEAYLKAFFGKLGTDDLLAAGRLDGKSFGEFQKSLANGVIAHSTDQPMPAVREFFEQEPISDQGKDGYQVGIQKQRFNDFAALLENGSLAPSKDFGTALINASLNAQKDLQNVTLPTSPDSLEGAPKLLSLAATNDSAATAFLKDKDQVNRLLHWDHEWTDDGRAVGELMKAGTLPEGNAFTPGERDKMTAGYTMMGALSEQSGGFTGHGRQLPSQAQAALADIVTHPGYLSHLSEATTGGRDSYLDPNENRFQLSADDRNNLLSVVLSGDTENVQRFKDGVEEYVEHRARDVFDDAENRNVTAEMRQLGKLSAAVSNAELDLDYQQDKRADASAKMEYQMWSAGIAGIGELRGPWARPFSFADAGMNLVSEPVPEAERNDNDRRTERLREGAQPELHRIYDAARDAGYRGMDETQAAHVIPRNGGNWPTDPELWDIINTREARNERESLTDALGDVGDDFLAGREEVFDRGAARNNFGDDEYDEFQQKERARNGAGS